MRVKRAASVLVAALAAAWAAPANAAMVLCTLLVLDGVSFGTYDPNAAVARDGTGSFTYTCTAGLGGGSFTIGISRGGAPNFTTRQLRAGSYTLDYQLYLDASRQTVWGDGSAGTSVYGPIPVGSLGTAIETRTVYGRIRAGQTGVGAGNYGDTVVVTVNY